MLLKRSLLPTNLIHCIQWENVFFDSFDIPPAGVFLETMPE